MILLLLIDYLLIYQLIEARHRSRYLRFLRPPQNDQLLKSKKLQTKQRKANQFLQLVLQ